MNDNLSTNNTDCNLVDKLWKFLSDPNSGEFYIKNIINNGLKVPALGIDLAPFNTISVGDIPKQQMFKEPVLGYMNLTMTQTSLNGIGSYESGKLTCTPTSPTDTQVDLSVTFSGVTFAGKYDVGTGGIAGCAIATGAAITGGHAHDALAAESNDPSNNIELAQWYRDVALPKSDNGKTLVGAYYAHQDTIQKVQLANNNMSQQYRTVLAESQQQQTKGAVTDATSYYQESQAGQDPSGSAPTIGTQAQYNGGGASHIALMKATAYMMQQEGLAVDDGNEYAELLNAMTQFNDNIYAYQQKYPNPEPASTVMNYVATAQPVNENKIPLYEFNEKKGGALEAVQTGEVDPWPLNLKHYQKAYMARHDATEVAGPEDTFNIDGDFSDQAQQLTISVSVSFSNSTGSLVATAKSITMSMGSLKITISNSGWGGHESLYDKIATWVANTKVFQDILKSKIKTALNSQSTLNSFSKALNAGIKKLGL